MSSLSSEAPTTTRRFLYPLPYPYSSLPAFLPRPSSIKKKLVPFLSKSSGKSLGITENSSGLKPISCIISCRRGLLEARNNVAELLRVLKWGMSVEDVSEGVEDGDEADMVLKQEEAGRGRWAGRTNACAVGGEFQHKTEAAAMTRNWRLAIGDNQRRRVCIQLIAKS